MGDVGWGVGHRAASPGGMIPAIKPASGLAGAVAPGVGAAAPAAMACHRRVPASMVAGSLASAAT